MSDQSPRQRVSAVRLPDAYELPGPLANASSEAQDAYRQTNFLLRSDLRLFEEGMRLQLQVAHEASHSSFRTHAYAALIALWSRTYLSLTDACVLATRGSYSGAISLVPPGCEYIAAQQLLRNGGMPRFLDWLAQSLSPSDAHKATEIGLGPFSADEALASDERVGAAHRAATDLTRPNLGSTLLAVGPESNNQRLALAFGDQAFHFGWAQLVLGWLLLLCERQLAFVAAAKDVFGEVEGRSSAVDDYARRIDGLLTKSDRCRVEEIDGDGARRYLLHNVRRAPGGAGKRMLL